MQKRIFYLQRNDYINKHRTSLTMVFDQKPHACVMLQGYTSLAEKLGKEVEEEERRGLPEARAALEH